MSFQIIGDDVYYQGDKVMTFCDAIPTVREKVEHLLAVGMEDLEDDAARFASEVGNLEGKLSYMEDECGALTADLERCEKRRDALAAILGVNP